MQNSFKKGKTSDFQTEIFNDYVNYTDLMGEFEEK